MEFFGPQMFLKLKDDLKAISPFNWDKWGAIGLARTKDAAKAKAVQMAQKHDLPPSELEAIVALIDGRDDFWPS